MRKFRKGDIVTVEAEVTRDHPVLGRGDNYVSLLLNGWKDISIPETSIISVVIPYFVKGDIVSHCPSYDANERREWPNGVPRFNYVVIASFEGKVWAKRNQNGQLYTLPSDEVELVYAWDDEEAKKYAEDGVSFLGRADEPPPPPLDEGPGDEPPTMGTTGDGEA